MILYPIIDLLKRIVVALPDYAGGGGSIESLLPTKDILSIEEYIQAEDWLSDSLGNTLNFAQTYMEYDTTTDFVIAYVYNNTANQFQASCLFSYSNSSGGSFTNTYSNRAISAGASFWVSAGSKVRVIHLTSNNKSQMEVNP